MCADPVPRYLRISVHDRSDLERLYPLILSYVRDPELAASVKEFVFRSYLPPHELYLRKTNAPEELRAAEARREVSQETIVARAVECLNLEGGAREEWIRILSWKKPELVAARQATLAAQVRSYEISPFFGHRDIVSAHHAAALLLMLCPNVETLVYEDGSHILKDLLRRNNYGLLRGQYLQNLRHVTVLHTNDVVMGDERFYVNADLLEIMRLFHRLPKFESLSIDGVGQNNDGGYLEAFPPATSAVKKIRIGHSLYGTQVIGTLLRVPKALEEFTWTTGGRCNLDGGYNMRYPKTLGKALLQHRATLRKIDIDIDEYVTSTKEGSRPFDNIDEGGLDEEDRDDDNGSSGNELNGEQGKDEWWRRDKAISSGPQHGWEVPDTREYRDTIGSLHDFEALTHLSIGVQLLLGQSHRVWDPVRSHSVIDPAPFRLIQALPKSLEYLLIRGYTRGQFKEYDDQFDELMAKREECLPKLKQIHGIQENVPSAESIEGPDDHPEDLWEHEEIDGAWVEVKE